jgi:4-amino-4-deoxy-L-arabinose transferase-like glycosyltransferase
VPISRKTLELYALPLVLTVLLLLPHFLYFSNGYVDLEGYCVGAGREIARHGLSANLTDYFATVVNPIFSVLLLAGSYRLFGESPVISRLTIFIVSYLFSLFLYYYLRNKKGAFYAFIATLLVIVNPMFIIYSQYVYSDVPFMAFSAAALLLLLFSSSWKGNIISAIMLGISLATKYVAVILYPVALIYHIIKSNLLASFSRARLLSLVRLNIWYFALSLAVGIPLLLVALHYQSSIMPSEYESIHTLEAATFVPRFFSYLLWLGLFTGPFCIISLFDLWKKAGTKKCLVLLSSLVILTLIISRFYPIASLHIQSRTFGEMNLGWVESSVPSPVLSGGFFLAILVAELFIASLIFDLKRFKSEKTIELFIWIGLSILLMSFTRVANRYLLTILVPLSLYMASVITRMYRERKKSLTIGILALHVLIFLATGFYSNYYLHLRGLAG